MRLRLAPDSAAPTALISPGYRQPHVNALPAATASRRLYEIRNEIDLAALAVIGLRVELDDDPALIIADRLRLVSDRLDDINDRLSPVDMEATKLKLASIEGKRAA